MLVLDTVKLQEFAVRLRQLKSVIEALEGDRRGSSDVVELDQTRTGRLSRMDALQAQQMAKAGHARSKIELRRIEAALRRIESGDFGDCIDCGNAILLARLEANPTVTLCLACAMAREN